jgi:hypothetical protein
MPSICFVSPLNPSTLTITIGLRRFIYHFGGNQIVPCAQGISALIGSPGTGLPPAFEFDGINALTVSARGPAGTLQGFAGQIALDPGGTTVLGSSAVVSLRSTEASPLATSLNIAPGSQSLTIASTATTSVITSSGQLVPSEWARQSDVLIPLLGGFVTALVVAPLGVSLQVLMDALKRWQGPLPRRDRRRGKKERRHAPEPHP